jgi:hypothetical protein
LPLPSGIWIIGRSIFTRFYPPVGKALPLWLMDYTHNLKIHEQPDINSSRGQFHILADLRLSNI